MKEDNIGCFNLGTKPLQYGHFVSNSFAKMKARTAKNNKLPFIFISFQKLEKFNLILSQHKAVIKRWCQ